MVNANENLFLPMGAILVYGRDDGNREQAYVEYFDMDAQGHPVNGRPLTHAQSYAFVECLQSGKENKTAFATPKGLLPPTVLYVNPTEGGTVIWYTRAAKKYLHFTDGLGIPCGETSPNVASLLGEETGSGARTDSSGPSRTSTASFTASTSESAAASSSSSWTPASTARPLGGSGRSLSRFGGT